MKIEIAVDHQDAREFAAWLRNQGHDAWVGNTTWSQIDDQWTNQEPADEIFRDLWERYCNA